MRGDKGGDNLREAPNIGLWLENLVSFVICHLWEVLPYDVVSTVYAPQILKQVLVKNVGIVQG